VELLPGAQLIGQLFTSRLNIVEGAVFQGDICVGPKAMQAASEAFSQGEQETEQTMLSSMMAQSHDEPEQADDEQEAAPAAASHVRTNPGSVNAVLQRRRPKILAPRNG